ncbi:MAG: cytochrome b/b6 domain-containing protein [Sutterellaceae bacterium]|nr:cytochrome b/b6 domain-containing protein [Sutterellaceae bacterium]MDY2868567.1 cytochrome b/b6 domain-containing protein [Mesosutterella sp.]
MQPELCKPTDRVLRYHPADKIFHTVNAITWFALLITGALVYFLDLSDETKGGLMVWHLGLAVIFTLNIVAYLCMAPHRFAVTMKNLLEWDSNSIRWFLNLGGYPRRFFHIPLGPVEVPPQGRYNGGQKMSYLMFFFAIFTLAITGWILWVAAPLVGKMAFKWMFYYHVWAGAIVSVLVVCAHIPLALLSWSHVTGLWRLGSGTISVEAAMHHTPIWFKRDVIRVNPDDSGKEKA